MLPTHQPQQQQQPPAALLLPARGLCWRAKHDFVFVFDPGPHTDNVRGGATVPHDNLELGASSPLLRAEGSPWPWDA